MIPILSGNVASALPTGYDVANSVRFNKPDVPYLHKALSSGNRKTWTYSAWVKRGKLGVNQYFLPTQADPANNNAMGGSFNANDKIDLFDYNAPSVSAQIITNRVFRDVGSWYHIAIIVDTTQSSANDRLKLFVNGVNERTVGGYSTDTMPALNYDFNINESSHSIYIGTYFTSSPATSQFDGYMSEVVFLDGTAAAIGDLGEFDEDSPTIWKPKDVSGLTPGTNGFYLDFEDSSNLGNDAFGGTDLTEVNLAATDQSSDSPTNNFCTLNSLDSYWESSTFSEGNLKIITESTDYSYNTSTIGLTAGMWYCEVYIETTPHSSTKDSFIGIAGRMTEASQGHLGYYSDTYAIYGGNGNIYNNNSGASYGVSHTTGDIIGIYLDLDNNKLYFAKNGTIMNSGTGKAISAASATKAGAYFMVAADFYNGASGTYRMNFGNPIYSLSSANADANGYGSFEYDPSSGTFDGSSKNFYAICTKNLAEFGG